MKETLLVSAATLAVASLLVCDSNLSQVSAAELARPEATVRKADADWTAMARSAGVDAWVAFYATDAIVLLPNDQLASGKELVRSSVARLLALPHFSVVWHPIKVDLAPSGELAYLIGEYELRRGDSHGPLSSERGRRVEIWRTQADGTWKCIVDTWNSDEPNTFPVQAAPPPAEVQGSEPPAASLASGPPASAQVLAAKYGDIPTHYEERIRQYFADHLRVPDSVQFREITKPEKGYTTSVSGTLLMREMRDYGWTVKATISAKNSHGSYVGFKSYTFLFRGEKIIHTIAPLIEDEMN